MVHRLFAREGQRYLSPRIVLDRLESEFAYVESSDDEGRRHVQGLIRQLIRIKQMGKIPVDNEHLDRLKKAQNAALYVYFGDNPSSDTGYLCTAVIPGEPLIFDYTSREHQRAARPLLVRCAEALDYEIVEM